MTQESWYDSNTDAIDEYNKEVILLRAGYYGVLYILLIPFLLKDSLEKLKPIAFLFLMVLVTLLIDLMIEGLFFRSFYKD